MPEMQIAYLGETKGFKVKLIPLTQGKFSMVDDEDFDEISKQKWYFTKSGYAVGKLSRKTHPKNRTILMHREILKTPDGFQTDHINGDKLDNRRSNLRVCTSSQNRCNSSFSSKNKLKMKGVYLTRYGTFYAKIAVNGIQKNLRSFKTPYEANEVYKIAVVKYHGEFARI